MDRYIGKLLDNRYELLELIGIGGMARVYKARCHRLNRLVAVKILRDDLAQDSELRRRFHEESQAVAMLSHTNIVAVYDVSRTSELEYIVMELIDGITLKQYMQKKGNQLNWREALHFITQIVKALGHAHSRGIIHRDIKPHNIMVLRDGSVKVADFGIARVMSGSHSTLTQEALGSVHYISPEQARGSHIDARSDLYSAGVVLYEMITGRLPFEGDTPVSVAIQHINSIPLSPREIDPDIPEALEAITMRAMAPNPDQRYASADEMLADLEEFRKNPNMNLEYHPPISILDEPDEIEKTQVLSTGGSKSRASAAHGAMEATMVHRTPVPPARRQQREVERDEGERDYRQPRSSLPMVGAVVAILIFVGALLYMMFSSVFSSIDQPQSQQVQVPKVVGYLMSEVDGNTSILGSFTLEKTGEREDESPAGTILEQIPKASTTVAQTETTIQVVVSSGPPEEILMPDLTDKPLQTALNELNQLGDFEVDFTSRSEYNDTIERDHVISTIPVADTVIKEGDKIFLTMSLGKKSELVTMMDIRGLDEDGAIKAIQGLGLTVGSTERSSNSEYPEGEVWFQSIAPNQEVEKGTVVNIIISTGSGEGDGEEEPEQPDEGEQGTVGTVNKVIHFALPDTGSVITVEIRDSRDIVVYGPEQKDTNFDTGIDATVTGSGSEQYTLYIDGKSYSSQVVEFEAES